MLAWEGDGRMVANQAAQPSCLVSNRLVECDSKRDDDAPARKTRA
jgi:hypothetical protein